MRYALAASVALKWELPEPDSDKANQLRDDFRNRVHDPIEVRLTHRVHIGIRRRVHEVNRIRNPILTRKLDCIEVISQSAAQS